ncbi:MAG: aminoglycoside adenylyltransferase domain-containing protein [Nocardioides sp.]
MRPLDARVEVVCATFLAVAPPGLLTGLYLRGGTGFGEWVPGQSDVDFVAILDHRPVDAEVEALRSAHVELAVAQPDISFDGCHLLAADLRGDPADCPEVPCVLDRDFAASVPVHDATVAWHELAWHGVRVRGPAIADLGIWTDVERLLAFTRGNLGTYWRETAQTLSEGLAEGGERRAAAGSEVACAWSVLGVARLDHLLVTSEMTTKSRAGRWGLEHYPERFHRVLREALRIRDGGPAEYAGDGPRGADTAGFTAYVVAGGAPAAG